MNDLEKDKLRVLLSDSVLLSALRKVFEEVVEESLPKVENEDDSVIGQKYRAFDTGKKFFASMFMKLEEYRSQSLSTDDLPSPE